MRHEITDTDDDRDDGPGIILQLPDAQRSKILAAMQVEPATVKQLRHVATLTTCGRSPIAACAVANYARWILSCV